MILREAERSIEEKTSLKNQSIRKTGMEYMIRREGGGAVKYTSTTCQDSNEF